MWRDQPAEDSVVRRGRHPLEHSTLGGIRVNAVLAGPATKEFEFLVLGHGERPLTWLT